MTDDMMQRLAHLSQQVLDGFRPDQDAKVASDPYDVIIELPSGRVTKISKYEFERCNDSGQRAALLVVERLDQIVYEDQQAQASEDGQIRGSDLEGPATSAGDERA